MNSPIVFVIFGATGDLMKRKLAASLFSLWSSGQLSHDSKIIAIGRRDMSEGEFTAELKEAVIANGYMRMDSSAWDTFAGSIRYIKGLFEEKALYGEIVTALSGYDAAMKACIPRFFYLATPPEHYETILSQLRWSELSEGCGHGTVNFTRILIEKPFGRDLETAKHLDELLATIFEERQIYRIDHYLGKETVQNILAFRFANGIFEPTWNNSFIDHVQITFSEELGIGSRGSFYDGVGALRDVVQNHILELVALVAMEQPAAFDATSVRDQKVAVIKAIHPIIGAETGKWTVRGQYEGFRREPGVSVDSATETFVALKLKVRTPRWRDVPFYIRTGKKMARKVTEISLHYKKPALCFDDVCLFNPNHVSRNVLSLRIAPGEGIVLRLMVKKPGFGMDLTAAYMKFLYTQAFAVTDSPDAYEKLLLDAIMGDQMLFARTDGIEASWKYITSIMEGWQNGGSPVFAYPAGSWGPEEATAMIESDERRWFIED